VQAAGGNTYYVSPTGTAITCISGNTFSTIGAALSCATGDGTTAAAPDTISIAAGTYDEFGLDVNANVSIQGVMGATTIDAQQQGRVLFVEAGMTVSLSGLTLTNGIGLGSNFVEGGAIYNAGTLSVTNSTLSGNTGCILLLMGCDGGRGGAIYNTGTLSVSNSTLSGNVACIGPHGCGDDGLGGGIANLGTLTLSNSTLTGNTACSGIINGFACESRGGGIFNIGSASISNSTLSANSGCTGLGCTGIGGGVYNFGTLTMSNSTLGGKTSSAGNFGCNSGSSTLGCLGFGGGLANYNAASSVTLSNDTITFNAASSFVGGDSDGGGIYGGVQTLRNDTIKNNTPDNCSPSMAGCQG
jgi:hypothetical protein